jgi:hypothetical protein
MDTTSIDLISVMKLYNILLSKHSKIKYCHRVGNEVSIRVEMHGGQNNDNYTIYDFELQPGLIHVKWDIHMKEWAHP